MMTLYARITGIGWVFACSMGRPGHVQTFPCSQQVPKFSGKSVLKVPYKPFGRMDTFSRLGFTAISFAMDHAGIAPVAAGHGGEKEKRDIALIAESKTGCLETDLLYQATLSRAGGSLPSPALFAYTLPSCFLGEASIYFGLTGESYMMEKNDDTGLTALSTAMDCLDSGLYSTVVCGVCNFGPKNVPPPGALFLVLEPCDGPSDHDLVITRNSVNTTMFYLGKKQIKTLIDLTQYNIETHLH